MILLKAKHIQFPEYHKVYHLNMLGNFIDYRRKQSTSSQTMRLESLMKDLDENGMTHPIIVSWNAYNVSVGHQRVWYAKEKGYTQAEALQQARVAHILRHGEYNKKTGKVKLWTI